MSAWALHLTLTWSQSKLWLQRESSVFVIMNRSSVPLPAVSIFTSMSMTSARDRLSHWLTIIPFWHLLMLQNFKVCQLPKMKHHNTQDWDMRLRTVDYTMDKKEEMIIIWAVDQQRSSHGTAWSTGWSSTADVRARSEILCAASSCSMPWTTWATTNNLHCFSQQADMPTTTCHFIRLPSKDLLPFPWVGGQIRYHGRQETDC